MNEQVMREKIERHWGQSGMVKIRSEAAIFLGFSAEDAQFLEEIGFPEWAAPNIWMHEPRSDDSEIVFLGEDRNDRPFIYRKATRAVVVGSSKGVALYVSHDLASFLTSLVLYADMVDAAISTSGSEVFVKNNIPAPLIAAFESGVLDVCPIPEGESSFWVEEIGRLRAGCTV